MCLHTSLGLFILYGQVQDGWIHDKKKINRKNASTLKSIPDSEDDVKLATDLLNCSVDCLRCFRYFPCQGEEICIKKSQN